MAKKGFNLADFSSVRGPLRNSGWVLCVGAGTSGPLFPDWGQLVLSLIAADPVVTNTSRTFASLRDTKGFSLDALIQAAQDRLALSDDAFADRLSTRLYSKLPADPVRARMLRCLAAVAPGELPKSKWQEFIKDVTSPSLSYIPSAVALSDIVARSRGTVMAPKAILSFNAEPLLYALINAQYAVKNNKPVATPTTGVPEPQVLTPITRSISNRRVDRIPYYFCHGLLRVGGINHGLLENGSPEKLVFSESTYLSLANESFSWQAATFISLAQAHSLIFVGMSLTDSNIRKWLSWMYDNRRKEIAVIKAHKSPGSAPGPVSGVSTLHYWLNVKPTEPGEQEWIESLVGHLGIRLVWLDHWGEIATALDRLTQAV